MKVFYILSSSSIIGGSSRSFLDYITEMNNRKDIELMVSVPCKGPAYDILREMGILTVLTPVRFNIYPSKKTPLFFIKLFRHLYLSKKSEEILLSHVNAHKPDIICTNVSVVNIGYNVAQKLGIPHVYHIREYQDLDFNMQIIPSKETFIKRLQKSYSICITKGIQRHYALEECPHSRVIYDGIHINKVEGAINRDGGFLFVGRLDRSKGIKDVLRAFSSFNKKHSGHELNIAGMAPSISEQVFLENMCQELDIKDKVHFLGARNDIDKLMQKAYAVIIASEFEALGRVTIEAMFNNCLVIGRDTTGTKEQFDNGLEITGKEIGIRFKDQDDLAKKMEYAKELSLDDYKAITTRARDVVGKLYTPKICAESIYQFFRQIIQTEKSKK